MNDDLSLFLQAWTGGSDLSGPERNRLIERLKTDATFHAECMAEIRMLGMLKAAQSPPPRWLDLHDALQLTSHASPAPLEPDFGHRIAEAMRSSTSARTQTAWLSPRPLFAATAGIVLGMLCTSVVFGFVSPWFEKRPVTLLQESFESGPAPLITGVPSDVDHWSGDHSRIAPAIQGVKPLHGSRMLQLLRSDYEGRNEQLPSRQGDLMRLIDVRPYVREANGHEVMLTLSAQFNASPFPESERYDGRVTIYALDATTNLNTATELKVKEEALAFSAGVLSGVDNDPTTWQIASTQILLPPRTQFVMLKISFCRMPSPNSNMASLPSPLSFQGNFVDDVRAAIRVRPNTPSAYPHHAP